MPIICFFKFINIIYYLFSVLAQEFSYTTAYIRYVCKNKSLFLTNEKILIITKFKECVQNVQLTTEGEGAIIYRIINFCPQYKAEINKRSDYLIFNPELTHIFCIVCGLFASSISKGRHYIITTGLKVCIFGEVNRMIKSHETSDMHLKSIEVLKNSGNEDDSTINVKSNYAEICRNRYIVNEVIRTIMCIITNGKFSVGNYLSIV